MYNNDDLVLKSQTTASVKVTFETLRDFKLWDVIVFLSRTVKTTLYSLYLNFGLVAKFRDCLIREETSWTTSSSHEK